jgi:archaellum biogenesis ATPase FlaH
MIVGQPSSGKSAVAQWMSLKWLKEGYRGIYWSADATARPAAARVVSMSKGWPTSEVEAALEGRSREVLGVLDDYSKQGLQWVFDSTISGESLLLNIDAFREMWGADPDWVVLDNLTDVDTRDGDEFSVLRATMRDVNYLARETNAGLVVLHHTSAPVRKLIHFGLRLARS